MLRKYISGINIKSLPDCYHESNRFTRKYVRKTGSILKKTLKGFSKEADETQEMAASFFNLLEHKLKLNNRKDPPSKKEVEEAIEQLKDVGRISVFATVSILPGGGLSLIGLELLAKKFGVTNFTFIPSSFRKSNDKKSPEN